MNHTKEVSGRLRGTAKG